MEKERRLAEEKDAAVDLNESGKYLGFISFVHECEHNIYFVNLLQEIAKRLCTGRCNQM